jgi:hypothetical protein
VSARNSAPVAVGGRVEVLARRPRPRGEAIAHRVGDAGPVRVQEALAGPHEAEVFPGTPAAHDVERLGQGGLGGRGVVGPAAGEARGGERDRLQGVDADGRPHGPPGPALADPPVLHAAILAVRWLAVVEVPQLQALVERGRRSRGSARAGARSPAPDRRTARSRRPRPAGSSAPPGPPGAAGRRPAAPRRAPRRETWRRPSASGERPGAATSRGGRPPPRGRPARAGRGSCRDPWSGRRSARSARLPPWRSGWTRCPPPTPSPDRSRCPCPGSWRSAARRRSCARGSRRSRSRRARCPGDRPGRCAGGGSSDPTADRRCARHRCGSAGWHPRRRPSWR